MSHLHRLVAICGWKHDGRGRGEAPEGRRPPALFDEKERMVVAIINRICIFAITYFTDKSRFVFVKSAHLQSSVFKLSKDLIDSIHEEGIVAYTS